MVDRVGTVRVEIQRGPAEIPVELERALVAFGYRLTHIPAALTVDLDRAHAVRVLAVVLDQIIADANAR